MDLILFLRLMLSLIFVSALVWAHRNSKSRAVKPTVEPPIPEAASQILSLYQHMEQSLGSAVGYAANPYESPLRLIRPRALALQRLQGEASKVLLACQRQGAAAAQCKALYYYLNPQADSSFTDQEIKLLPQFLAHLLRLTQEQRALLKKRDWSEFKQWLQKIVKEYRPLINWQGLVIPEADLSRADFNSMHLDGILFERCAFQQAIFSFAYFNRLQFRFCHFESNQWLMVTGKQDIGLRECALDARAFDFFRPVPGIRFCDSIFIGNFNRPEMAGLDLQGSLFTGTVYQPDFRGSYLGRVLVAGRLVEPLIDEKTHFSSVEILQRIETQVLALWRENTPAAFDQVSKLTRQYAELLMKLRQMQFPGKKELARLIHEWGYECLAKLIRPGVKERVSSLLGGLFGRKHKTSDQDPDDPELGSSRLLK